MSAGAAGRSRRSAMNSAVRRTESATRPTRSALPRPASGPLAVQGPGIVPSRAISAARVTASRARAVAGAPASRAGPKRCHPVADQYRTGTSRAAPEAGRGMRSGVPAGPSGRRIAASRTQQRRRFSTAAASAATAGSGWSRRSGCAVGSGPAGTGQEIRGLGVPSFWRGTVAAAPIPAAGGCWRGAPVAGAGTPGCGCSGGQEGLGGAEGSTGGAGGMGGRSLGAGSGDACTSAGPWASGWAPCPGASGVGRVTGPGSAA